MEIYILSAKCNDIESMAISSGFSGPQKWVSSEPWLIHEAGSASELSSWAWQ